MALAVADAGLQRWRRGCLLGPCVMWYNRYINRLRETDPEAAENELRPSVLDMME